MLVRVTIEAGPGQRAEFEREQDDFMDGEGNVLNAQMLRPMWSAVAADVGQYIEGKSPSNGVAR